MKYVKKIGLLLLLLLLLSVLPANGQENISKPNRSAEQEALRQTEKLQQELTDLTPEQVKAIYDINLKYERERQISNTRSQALERIKNKNSDFQRVLTEEQFNHLQNKRLERSRIDSDGNSRSGENRIPPELRIKPNVRRNFPGSVRVQTNTATPSTDRSQSRSKGNENVNNTRKSDSPARIIRK